MRPDWDPNGIVRSWLRTDEDASADRILDAVLEQVDATPQRQSGWVDRLPHLQLSASVLLATAAVIVIAAMVVSVLPGGWFPAGPAPSAEPAPSLVPGSESDGVIALPPDGVPPSDSTPSELVLSLGTPTKTTWFYADGRLITSEFGTPLYPLDGFIGLTERRLTPSGVAQLQAQVIATGLFDSDLELVRPGNRSFPIDIEVRVGDRLVRVSAFSGAYPGTAPVATAEQESTLTALRTLLSNTASWPDSTWADRSITAYVPSEYSVCFGVYRATTAEEGVWLTDPPDSSNLLPEPAQELLRAARQTQEPRSWMHTNGGCSRMTTDEARALAQALEDGGIHNDSSGNELFWLGYGIEDPATPNTIWMQFGPVLPDGNATWLGPG